MPASHERGTLNATSPVRHEVTRLRWVYWFRINGLLKAGVDWQFLVNESSVDIHQRLKSIYFGSLITLHSQVPLEPRYMYTPQIPTGTPVG